MLAFDAHGFVDEEAKTSAKPPWPCPVGSSS
jgi:hypothetical protein